MNSEHVGTADYIEAIALAAQRDPKTCGRALEEKAKAVATQAFECTPRFLDNRLRVGSVTDRKQWPTEIVEDVEVDPDTGERARRERRASKARATRTFSERIYGQLRTCELERDDVSRIVVTIQRKRR